MPCELCNAINEDWRLIDTSELSFCVIIKWPLKPGHLIVLPKRHVCTLNDLTDKEAKDLLTLCNKMLMKLKKSYKEDPLMLMNTGKHSSQIHLHFHVWPSKGELRELVSRYEGVPKREEISREEYDIMKEELTR